MCTDIQMKRVDSPSKEHGMCNGPGILSSQGTEVLISICHPSIKEHWEADGPEEEEQFAQGKESHPPPEVVLDARKDS